MRFDDFSLLEPNQPGPVPNHIRGRLDALIAEADAALERIRAHQRWFALERPGLQYQRIAAGIDLLEHARTERSNVLQATLCAYDARRSFEQVLLEFERHLITSVGAA